MSFRHFLSNGPVVLCFSPKDDSPGCTMKACAFRDVYTEFGKLDAEVIGISLDSVDSHRRFAEKYGLPFTLLSDDRREVRGLYWVPTTFRIFPDRVTYIIDEEGVTRHMFSFQLGVDRHVEEALKASNRSLLETRLPDNLGLERVSKWILATFSFLKVGAFAVGLFGSSQGPWRLSQEG